MNDVPALHVIPLLYSIQRNLVHDLNHLLIKRIDVDDDGRAVIEGAEAGGIAEQT